MDMLNLALSTTTWLRKRKPPQMRLRRLVAFGFFLVTAQLTHAAIDVNGTGTLLDTRASQLISSREGAVTMGSLDVLLPTASQLEIGAIETAPEVWTVASAQMSYPAPAASLTSSAGQFFGTQNFGGNEAVQLNDVTPAPETSTWVAALLAAAVATFSQRHRFGFGRVRRLENT